MRSGYYLPLAYQRKFLRIEILRNTIFKVWLFTNLLVASDVNSLN